VRKKEGVRSQIEVAQEMGCHPTHFCRVESGVIPHPSLLTFFKWADALGFEVWLARKRGV
jgi:hypothetical protein